MLGLLSTYDIFVLFGIVGNLGDCDGARHIRLVGSGA